MKCLPLPQAGPAIWPGGRADTIGSRRAGKPPPIVRRQPGNDLPRLRDSRYICARKNRRKRSECGRPPMETIGALIGAALGLMLPGTASADEIADFYRSHP